MFTNLILHFCQSDCLCRCQMYLFNAFCVIYSGNYKRYPALTVFDTRAYSTGVSDIEIDCHCHCLGYVWPFFSGFHRGKDRLLYFYLLSSTGKRWKPISGHSVLLLLQLGATQHWPLDIQLRADVIVSSTLKLDDAVALTFFRSLKPFRLTFLRMRVSRG